MRFQVVAAALLPIALLVPTSPALAANPPRTIQTQAAPARLASAPTIISGPLAVHLVYQDQNGKQQDLDLASSSQSLPAALPSGLQQLHTSPLLRQPLTSSFDQFWSTLKAQDCSDIAATIQRNVHNIGNNNDVTAYNVSGCTWATGFLPMVMASQVSTWADPPDAGRKSSDGMVTGQELLLDYWIPANTVTFSATTSTTGGIGNTFNDSDPQFTLVFDVHVYLTLSNVGTNSLSCPMTVGDLWNMDTFSQKYQPRISQSVAVETILLGNQSAAISSATQQAGASAAGSIASAIATGGAVSAADLAATAAKWVASLVGSGAASVAGSSVRDTVSQALGALRLSAQPQPDSVAPLSDFDAFNAGCAEASGQGFSQVGLAAMPDGSLRFTLTHPPFTTPPTLQVADVTSGSLIGPSISLSTSEINAGDQISVSGKDFNPQVADVWLTWGSSAASDDLEANAGSGWQPATYTVAYSGNQVTGLTPNTHYQFRVRECDAYTCGPYSNTIESTSAAQGSGKVSFYLDSVDAKDRIPNAAAPLHNGAFDPTVVTIPHDTQAGQHTLYAAIGDGWSQAGASLKVAAAGQHLTPVVQLTDSLGNVTSRLSPGVPVTVSGQNFADAHPVKITLDKPTGQDLGSAMADSGGQFTSSISPSSLPGGSHTLVARQVVNGKTIEASVPVDIELIQ